MKKVASRAIMTLGIAGMCVFPGITASGQRATIRVIVDSARHTVKNGENFLVSISIKNLTNDQQSLQIWSCSFPEEWISDNSVVHIPNVPCKKNSAIWITLKPRESYDQQFAIYIALPADYRAPEPVNFRLGFEPISFQETAAISPPIWSNSVKVDVIR